MRGTLVLYRYCIGGNVVYQLLLYRALRYRYTVATRCCERPPVRPHYRRHAAAATTTTVAVCLHDYYKNNKCAYSVSVARRNYDLRYYIILLLLCTSLCAVCIYITIIYDIINLLLYAVDEMKQKIKSKSTFGVRCPLFIVNKNTIR